MTDYAELKRLAELASPGPWLQENDDLYFKDDGYTRHMMTTDSGHDVCDDEDCDDAHRENLKYIAAANPAVVLALIAESEKLRADLREAKDAKLGLSWAIGEIKAENEKLKQSVSAGAAREWDLRSQVKAARESRSRVVQSNHALRKDAERFRFIVDCPIRTMVAISRLANENDDFDLAAECDRLNRSLVNPS